MTLLKKKAEVLVLIIILPLPHLTMLGDLALASDNTTRINIELGKRGYFSLESGKMCKHLFPRLSERFHLNLVTTYKH